jgi:diamine N-acetyltransferase
MHPTFRPAVPGDMPRLLDSMAELYGQDRIPFDAHRATAALTALLAEPTMGRAFVLEVEATRVGYVIITFGYSLEYGGRDAFIDELFISSPHRRQGLGTAALEFALDLCRSLAIHAVHLEVDQANLEAHTLYRRLGFEDHPRHLMTHRL